MADGLTSYLFVAAIDVGTTYSSFAYSSKDDYNSEGNISKIYTNTWNAGEKSMVTSKTPTILLLNKDKSFRAFGFKAENEYRELCENFCSDDSDSDSTPDEHGEKEDPKELYYFERFKMKLHNTKTFRSDEPIKELNGKSLPAKQVFAESIKFLVGEVFNRIKHAYHCIQADDVRYVLTVPAIWDDTAKTVMKEAAYEAGIAYRNLQIALEPEAASILCFEKFLEEKRVSSGSLEIGIPYMVVDLGGVTADITVHSRNYNKTLQEVMPPSGGPWGGKAVDDAFIKLMEDIFGKDIIEKFKKEHQGDFISLFNRDFQMKKQTTESSSGKTIFSIPFSLQQLLKKNKKVKSLADILKNSTYADKGVTYNTAYHRIMIPNDVIKDLFQLVAKEIVNHVKNMLKDSKLEKLRVIMMVGGFSNCQVVQRAMKEAFKDKSVIIPEEAELAVLQGAVLFGHKKTTISTRVARYTYGMQNWPLFDKSRHPESKRVVINGEERCRETFLKFIQAGQDIATGFEVKRIFQILETQRNKLECRIYKSVKENPKFIDEDGVTLVGTLEIPIDLPKGKTVDIEGALIFGDTTLSFQAINRRTGQQFQTHFAIPDDPH